MKILSNAPHSCRTHWLKTPLLSHPYRSWLVHQGSLTKRLQSRYADFSVQPVSLHYARPNREEAELLAHARRSQTLVREVVLTGGGEPVVFARSVLPPQSLKGAWRKLRTLGNQPLGATLFADRRVKRTAMSYKKLACHHPIYQRLRQTVAHPPATVWARRSIFQLNHARILVMEIFLPAVLLP